LIDFYKWFIDSKLTDDQIALGKYCNTYPSRVVVDVEGSDMCVVGPLYRKSFYKKDGRIQIDHNGRVSEPAIVHFSGEAADVLKLTYTHGNGKDGIPKEILAKLILQDEFVAQDPTFARVVYWHNKVFWLQWFLIFIVSVVCVYLYIRKKQAVV
jgi:hypothetical protein